MHISKDCNERWPKLAFIELIVGVLASGIAICLHIARIQHAGGLWRDEVATLNAAMAPTLSELWARLSYEIMPVLSPLVIRAWSLIIAGGSDFGLRIFGLLIGVCIIGAVWLNGHLCGYRIPFVSIGLLGFSSLLIATGDSIRPYGIAILLILITVGVIFKALSSLQPWWLAVSALFSILSVQCAYNNACLIFGACTGAIAVSAYRRNWKRLTAFTAVGAVAALSLLPYIGPLSRISKWSVVVQSPITLWHLLGVMGNAMGSPEIFMFFMWLGSAYLSVFLLVHKNPAQQKGDESNVGKNSDAVLFACIALPTSIVAYFSWLLVSRYITYPWHYLPLLAVMAVYLEIIIAPFVRDLTTRTFRLVIFVVVVILVTHPAYRQVQGRQTNIDIAAKIIAVRTEPNDLVVLNPWHVGISFQRYYTGPSAFTTVPPMGIVTGSRYDLLKKKMASANPLEPLVKQLEKTLQNGHRVWIVGDIYLSEDNHRPPQLPPAPQAGTWDNAVYSAVWSMQIGCFLQAVAKEIETINIDRYGPVSPYENVQIVCASGWRRNNLELNNN